MNVKTIKLSEHSIGDYHSKSYGKIFKTRHSKQERLIVWHQNHVIPIIKRYPKSPQVIEWEKVFLTFITNKICTLRISYKLVKKRKINWKVRKRIIISLPSGSKLCKTILGFINKCKKFQIQNSELWLLNRV